MEQLSCRNRPQRSESSQYSRTQLMNSKRCSNGKEMIKEHFVTTFHNMNSTTLLRLTAQFKLKKGKTRSQNTLVQWAARCHRGWWRPKGLKGLEKFREDRFHQGLRNLDTTASLGSPGITAGNVENIPAERFFTAFLKEFPIFSLSNTG